MLEEQVDVIGPESLERSLDRSADVGRGAVEDTDAAAGVGDDTELRGKDHLVPPVGQRPTDELLVRVGPVHLGGIDEGDTDVDRAVQRTDRLAFIGVRPGVQERHRHGAESDPGDLERAEPRVSHHPRCSRDLLSAAPRRPAYGVVTGRVSQPRTVLVRACSALSQSTSHSGQRWSTSSRATRPSRRASAAPRQKWMP